MWQISHSSIAFTDVPGNTLQLKCMALHLCLLYSTCLIDDRKLKLVHLLTSRLWFLAYNMFYCRFSTKPEIITISQVSLTKTGPGLYSPTLTILTKECETDTFQNTMKHCSTTFILCQDKAIWLSTLVRLSEVSRDKWCGICHCKACVKASRCITQQTWRDMKYENVISVSIWLRHSAEKHLIEV